MRASMRTILIALFIISAGLLTGFTPAEENVEVNWMSFEEAVEASKKTKKKIFIDVYTDWCGWCKVMDKNTFSQNDIAKYLNDNFYSVKLDAEGEGDITFKDHTYKFIAQGKKGAYKLHATKMWTDESRKSM